MFNADPILKGQEPGDAARNQMVLRTETRASPRRGVPTISRRPIAGRSAGLLLWLLCSAAWLPAQAQIPVINQNGLVNAATGRNSSSVPVTARGTLVAIYGSNLANTTLQASGFPLPAQLGGTQVLFGSIPAPLLYVSPNQITAQVPFEIPDVSAVNLVVQSGAGSSAPVQVTLLAQDPGIFVALKSSGVPVSVSNPVMAGDSITLYATGLGAVMPNVPSGQPGPSTPLAIAAIAPVAMVGGQPLTIRFAGLAPGQVSYQINATAPANLTSPSSNITLQPGVIPAVTGPPGPAGTPDWSGKERGTPQRPTL